MYRPHTGSYAHTNAVNIYAGIGYAYTNSNADPGIGGGYANANACYHADPGAGSVDY